jgi:riboflavin kinase/FMN adenylyltransferase
MQVLRTFDELAATRCPAYVAIGVFDGVHLGHQQVIARARDDARLHGGLSIVLTFDPHPIRVLRPDQAPLLLTSTAHKLALIEQLGVDACLLLTFDKQFAETPAEQFVATLAAPGNQLREICVGTRFRFGHNRAGDVRLLEKLAATAGFTLKEITSVHTTGGEMISSTALRQHVLGGDLDRAALMLGRPFSILGTVQRGDGVGRQLGYPTANVDPHNEALPPNGVYAIRARLGNETLPGIVNIGIRPTFAERQHDRLLEAHLFDFNRDIYNQDIEVIFVKHLRAEQKFASVAALRLQIAADEQTARQLLSS